MKLNFSILISIILITSCVEKQHSNKEDINTVPIEARKCIITTHYTPILHEGKWICGEEYSRSENLSDTIYYDENNNKLLRILKGGYAINKYIYHSPKEKLLEKIYSLQRENIDSALYIRNAENKLIELVVSGDIFAENLESKSYHYNNKGERSEIMQGDTKTTIEQSPSKDGLTIKTFRKFKKKADSSNELIEKGTEIFNPEGQLLRIINEYYKYGRVDKEEDFSFTYDEKNRRIKEEMKGQTAAMHFQVPNNLSPEEQEEYIRKNYYENIEYTPIAYIKEWKYNSHGDLESYIYKTLDNDSGRIKINPNFSERYEFLYNKEGEWVEKYSYMMYKSNILSREKESEENNEPYLISIREIIDL